MGPSSADRLARHLLTKAGTIKNARHLWTKHGTKQNLSEKRDKVTFDLKLAECIFEKRSKPKCMEEIGDQCKFVFTGLFNTRISWKEGTRISPPLYMVVSLTN
jgi:hypothetical protein